MNIRVSLKKTLYVVTLIATFCIQAKVFGQTPYVINFNKNDYNASSKNWSVAKDSKGVIYIGNDEGLLQFDGSRWKLHKLPGEMTVRSIAIDTHDRIYTGSYEEFGYWEEDSIGRLNYTSLSSELQDFNFHNEEIWRIVTHKNKVYFQAFSSLFISDGKKIEVLDLPGGIIFLLKANNRLIAQKLNEGLIEFIDNEFKLIKGSEKLSNANIKAFLPYEKDKFILGSEQEGLIMWDSTGFRTWECEAQKIIKNKQINNGIYDGKYYYIGTIVDGLFIINKKGEIVKHFNTENTLQNNTVLGLSTDNEGDLWVALDKGISMIKFNHPFSQITDNKTKLGAVYAAALFKNKLYLGTNQGIYYHPFNTNNKSFQLKNFSLVNGSQGQSWNLSVIDNQLLCGHNTGTFRIENDKIIPISSISGGFSFKKIKTNSGEYLIQSTYTSLVLYRKNSSGKWFFSNFIKGFVEPARFIEPDHLGNIWVSHAQKGIYKIRLNKQLDSIANIQYFDSKNGFPSDFNINVFNINNRIVFTTGEKLYTYDDLNKQIVPFQKLNNKIGDFSSVINITNAENNKYWFIKKNKIKLFNINNEDVKSLFSYRFTNNQTGMVKGFENIVRLNNEQNLICLENGFALYNNLNLINTHSKKKIFFREIYYDSKDSETTHLPLIQKNNRLPQIPYYNNHINFSFSAIKYPGNEILYQHQLEGFESTWSSPSYLTNVEFYRLPHGSYNFKIKAINEYDQSFCESSYKFEIMPPWHASKTAIIIYLIFGLGFLIGVPVGISAYLRRHKNKLKKEVAKKQKEDRMLSEQHIMKLRNENLEKELSHKSNELANSTMAIIRKNESLLEIKQEIEKQKAELEFRFPKKNYEKIIKLIDKNISSEDDWKIFETHFDRANENFFKILKNKYPNLTPSDLRLCAYLQMNLTSKEIAPLLGISIRGVENHRYRLRKKMDLGGDVNLIEFVMNFK